MISTRVCWTALLFVLATSCTGYRPTPVEPAATLVATARRHLPTDRNWTTATLLEQAVEIAPAIRESRYNYRSALAAAKVARQQPAAALQLTSEYSHQDNPNKPWLVGGALDLPLDVGARRTARVTAADLAIVQARYDYGEAVWTARSTIRHALIERIFAEREAPIAARILAVRTDRYDRLRARVSAGEEARPVSIMAQTDLATASRRIQDVAGRRAQADAAIAHAIGMEPAAVSPIAIEPLGVPAPPAPEQLADWRRDAALGRRDVLRGIVDYDLAENAVRQEVANQYPALRIQPGYTYERGIVKLPFGVNLQLPPWDLNRSAIRAAEAKRAQAGDKLEAVQTTVLGEVDKAVASLSVQRGNEETARTRDLPMARRLADAAAASLRAGEGDRVDEEAAAAAALEADYAELEAQRGLWLATADLEDALRKPFDPRDERVFEAAIARLGETK